jgi:hypothetical protein
MSYGRRSKRIWHPYWTWEDVGMWRNVTQSEHDVMLLLAIEFTSNATEYGMAMMEVIEQFPIACEHNLTESAMNRQAWIGHAAAFLRHDLPEYITREAWGMLTQEQREEANAMADRAIHEWEQRHEAQASRVHPQMAIAGLS